MNFEVFAHGGLRIAPCSCLPPAARELDSVLASVFDLQPGAVAEAPWSVAEWAVAPRFDNPRATVPVLVLG